MSECVVRMEMPKSCAECRERYLFCRCQKYTGSMIRRSENCPIICVLPEKHGRLVDADELKSRCRPVKNFENQDSLVIGVGPLRCSKTIVPATEGV